MDIRKSKLGHISGGKILDVGTGNGCFIETFIEMFKEYTEIIGIDSSDKGFKSAKEAFNKENIKFIQMDASKMDFADNSMDTVCISNTLHHLSNIENVLEEMLRVLKPGGIFIINEMFCDNQSKKQLSHVYIHHLFGKIDSLAGNYHANTFKRQEIIDAAKKIGLKIEDAFEYSTAEEQEGNSNAEEEIETFNYCFNSLDKYVEKVKDMPQYNDIKKEIQELREKLYKVGYANATELMVIARKAE